MVRGNEKESEYFRLSTTPPPLRTNESDPPAPPPAPRAPGTGYLECDFCHCKLTKTGEVYNISEQAREYRDEKEKHAKAVAKLDEEISNLRATITAKDAEIAQLKGSPVRSAPKDRMF